MCICCQSNIELLPGNHQTHFVYFPACHLYARFHHTPYKKEQRLCTVLPIIYRNKLFHMFLNGLYGIRSLPRNNNNDVVNIHVRLLGWHKLYWPSTSDIGDSKHTTQVLHEDQSGHGEMWRDGDVEASVSIQQTGVVPIQGKILNHTNIMWLRHFDYS